MGETRVGRRWNPNLIVLVLWTAILALLSSFPGFAGPSYPYGLVSGVFVGPFGAVWSAQRVATRRLTGVAALFCALQTAFWLSLALLSVAFLYGLRLGFCDFEADFTRLVLGAPVGALVASVWGALVAQTRSRRWLRYALALALPLGGYAFSFWRFYTSPMVFAFDHFAGYFAGTLYDTELGTLDRLLSYRVATAGLVVALSAFVLLSEVPLLVWWTRRGTLGGGFAGLALALGVGWRGPSLGHYQTTESIATALGDNVSSERCDVVFDSSIGRESASLLARECDRHVHELEHDLQVAAPARIRVFLFASADQKALLMGARHVYVAKPWREEIYINAAAFPHPVLRHELAHVVAGAFGTGPFKVAGKAWGLVPDPGRIEGVAVMAAPPEDETLSLAQWSAAMKRLGLMPRLGSLFQLGFFDANSSSAYTVAGAFLEWVATNHGVGAVKAWYAGQPLDVLTHSSWDQLERQFGMFLDQLAVSETELMVARARFERPAVLHRRCPHQVDGALMTGLQWLGRGNCHKARALFEQVLTMDPSALRAEFGRAECEQRANNAQGALQAYEGIAASGFASSAFKTAAWERAGDIAWQQGMLERAAALYESAQATTVDEDNLRQLDIKLGALRHQRDDVRTGVERFFFGPRHQGAFPLYTGKLLGEWVGREPSGLASYLLGKQYLATSQWELAAEQFDLALRGALQPRVRREALRALLISSCATDNLASVSRAWQELSLDAELTAAQQRGYAAQARRCGPRSN
jgi:hypothetical protein